MGLKVTINEHKEREDGTCAIRLYIYANGSHTYYPIKNAYCHPKSFNDGRVRPSHPNAKILNSQITSIYHQFEQLMLYNPLANAGELVRIYEGKGVATINASLLSFIDQYVKECKEGKIKRAPNTIKKYVTLKNQLTDYSPGVNFASIGKEFYTEFVGHLRTSGLKENSVGKAIKTLKAILSEANERNIYEGREHKKKYFKAPSVETDAIYFNENEIKKIESLKLKTGEKHLQSELDRFIVSYYFLLRYSDSIRIDKSMLYKNSKGQEFIQIRAQKTNNEVRVPVKPIVKNILERNKYSLSADTNQEANWKIKEVCRLAGIEEVVYVNGKKAPKHKFASTHTARRSGATNLYLQGVSVKFIMDLGGWKTMKEFMGYIRITKQETADTMADHPFFK